MRRPVLAETVSVAVSKAKMNSLRSLKNNNEEKDGFAVVIQLECVGDQVEMKKRRIGRCLRRVLLRYSVGGKRALFRSGKSVRYRRPERSSASDVLFRAAVFEHHGGKLVKLQVVKQHIFVNGSSRRVARDLHGLTTTEWG